MVMEGEKGTVAEVADRPRPLLSLSPCCRVEARRNSGRSVVRSVARLVCRSVGLSLPRSPAPKHSSLTQRLFSPKKTNDQRHNSVTVTCHPVTLTHHHRGRPVPSYLQPQSGAPQSASASSQSNPGVLPTPNFLTSILSLLSLLQFLAPITPPAADLD